MNLAWVRDEARGAGLCEIYHNERSKVVSFAATDDRYSMVRVNVYYTTGTVGTCLEHPRQGKTQLFRRNVDLALLGRLFREPRLHTGAGYHRREDGGRRRVSVSPGDGGRRQRVRRETCSVCMDAVADVALSCGHVTTCGACAERLAEDDGNVRCPLCRDLGPLPSDEGPLDEEEELRIQARRLKTEADEVDVLLKACVERREARERREAEARRREEEAAAEERRRREAAAAEAQRRREAEEAEARRRQAEIEEDQRLEDEWNQVEARRCARGTHIQYYLHEGEFIDRNFNSLVTCIATNGTATIMLYENGTWSFTGSLTKLLHNKLNGRAIRLPSPDYVAMGTLDRYYIRFADGKSEWVGCEAMGEALKETSRRVKSVAFGEQWDSYFIVFEDGWWCYSDVPSGLTDLITRRRGRPDLSCVSLGGEGQWYLKAKNGKQWWGGLSSHTIDQIRTIKDRLTFLDFGDSDEEPVYDQDSAYYGDYGDTVTKHHFLARYE